MNIKMYLYLIILPAMCLCFACKKTKLDSVNPSSQDLMKTASSNIRLFNFTDYDVDLTINNIPLTAYGKRDIFGTLISGSGSTTQLGLQYFPKGAWKAAAGGSPFSIPTTLLDKNGASQLRITIQDVTIDTTLINEVLQPKDYYLFRQFKGGRDVYSIAVLNRESNPPAQASWFKIRIINKQQENDPLELTGPVTLTYADGTPVHSKLTNIAPDAISEYVELPYGAYQFKLFATNGVSIDVTKQLTELPVQPDYQSSLPLPQPQQGCIIPVRTYKPGGVYTMMLSGAAMLLYDKYPDGISDQVRNSYTLNSYRLITDIEPVVNFSFARVQAANAAPGDKLKILVDGSAVGNTLGFGESSSYITITRGTHMVSLTDAGGKVLAEKSLTVYPYDNYTIWAWQNSEGNYEIVYSAIDMTATTYNNNAAAFNTSTNDGAIFLNLHPYAWSTRFLNFAPDLPNATFTNDQSLFTDYQYKSINNVNLPSPATYHHEPGKPLSIDPFLVYAVGKKTLGLTNPANDGYGSASRVRVYKSSGVYGELPGQLLPGIAPIDVQKSFIANPALYTIPSLKPWAEGGIYTVALIGKVTTTNVAEKARLIVIKHNQ